MNWENGRDVDWLDDYEDGRDGDYLDAAPVGSPPDPTRPRRFQLQVPSLSSLHRLQRSFHALTGMCSLAFSLPYTHTLPPPPVTELCSRFCCDISELWLADYFTREGFDFESRGLTFHFFEYGVFELALDICSFYYPTRWLRSILRLGLIGLGFGSTFFCRIRWYWRVLIV